MRHHVSTLRVLLLLASLLAATGCATRSPHRQTWHVLDTPHFRVLSSLEVEETRFLARDLELFHAGVAYILGGELPNPPKKAVVYAFDDRSLARPFAVRGASGYYLPTLATPTLVFRAGGGFADDSTPEMLHQYAHFLVRQSDKRRPLWYEEGIAQMASTIEPRGGHARVAPPRGDHVRTLRDWARASIDPTIETSDLTRSTLRDRERFIAESWALAHYATLAPASRQGPERPLIRFRHALDNGAQPGQSARIAFDSRGEVLGQHIRDYLDQKALTFASVVPRDGWKPASANLRKLTPSEVHLELGRLSLALERARDAARYFRVLAEEDPEALSGLAAAYRVAGSMDRAQSHIEQALERAPDNLQVQLEAGQVYQALAESGEAERDENLTLARAHYSRAATLDPELATARALHASTYLIEGQDPSLGLPLATSAYRSLPGSLEIQLLFARLEAKRGKRSPALLHAADVASRGHDLNIEDDAKELIDSLRKR